MRCAAFITNGPETWWMRGVLHIMSTTILRHYRRPDSQGDTRPFTEYVCDHCETPHSRPTKDMKVEHNYCSTRCFYETRQGRITVECAYCHDPCVKKRSQLAGSKSGLYFCSRVCKDQGQSLKGGITAIQPSHFGTALPVVDYRAIAFACHSNECNRCGWGEHRDVLEVHHRDRNRQNNEAANLEILCPTHHQVEHYLTRTGRYRFHK